MNFSEQVKKVKQKLTEYEAILKIKQKNDSLYAIAQSIEKTDAKLGQAIKDIIGG